MVPAATPVTNPADDTVARDELDVVHVMVGLAIVLSLASFTVAVMVAVSLTKTSIESADSVIEAAA